jgi:V/A-type H+-transporting ATPase subunit I
LIVPLKKLVLITLRDFERQVIRRLGELGVVHLRRMNIWDSRELLEGELGRTKELEETCVKLTETWYSLYEPGFEEEKSIFRRYVEVRDELRRLYASRIEPRRLRDVIAGIKAMGEDEVPPPEPGAELSALLIIAPEDAFGRLVKRIEGFDVIVKRAELPGNEALLYLVVLRDRVEEVRELLGEVYYQEIWLPDYLPRRCDEALAHLDLRLSEVEKRILELEGELEELRVRLIWAVDEGGQRLEILTALRSEVLRLRDEFSIEVRAGAAGDISLEEAKRLLDEVSEKYNSIRGRLDKLRAEREELEKMGKILGLLSGLDIGLPEIRDYENLAILIGAVDEGGVDRIREALRGSLAVVEVLATRDGKVLLTVTCLKEHLAEVGETLRGAGLEDLSPILAKLSGNPSEALEEVSRRLEPLRAEKERLLENLSELRRNMAPKLVEIYEALELNLRLEEALRGSLQTDYLRIVQGWVSEDAVVWLSEKLEEMRRELKGVVAYRFEDPKPGEKAPTLLKNPGVFKVFESIVALYGWPSRHEIDPTMISGILWTIMFGLMFPDLGQGIAIIAMGLFFTHVFKRRILGMNSRKIGRLMMGMGLSASFFGALFGEFFLVEVQPHLPGLRPGWLGESSSIIWLIKIAIFFGIAQILLGIALAALKEFRNGETVSAIFSHHGAAGLITYSGFILTAFHFLGVTVVPRLLEFPELGIGALMSWPFFLMIGGLVMMILKPILEHEQVSLGLGSLLETMTAFLANTLSFTRVAGFTIVHAALAMVVHEMMCASPAMGIGLGLILLNLVSLSIELLVVAIQGLRLLFYEFYSKFYEGSGIPYRPWTLLNRR